MCVVEPLRLGSHRGNHHDKLLPHVTPRHATSHHVERQDFATFAVLAVHGVWRGVGRAAYQLGKKQRCLKRLDVASTPRRPCDVQTSASPFRRILTKVTIRTIESQPPDPLVLGRVGVSE